MEAPIKKESRKKIIIWVVTLFPEYFAPLKECGVVGQALRGERELSIDISLKVVPLRNYSLNKYGSVDDYSFGGGPGMVMRADVLYKALYEGVYLAGEYDKRDLSLSDALKVIYPSPRGKVWNYKGCRKFARENFTDFSTDTSLETKDLVFICGRYEGIDERFLENYVDEHISLGDFVLSGGELAVMALLDSCLRFIPGTLGNDQGANLESFEEDGFLEAPHYTRPREFQDHEVPEIFLSGHHKNIQNYRKQKREELTQKFRPDLLGEKET